MMEGSSTSNQIVLVPKRAGSRKFLRPGSKRQTKIRAFHIDFDKVNSQTPLSARSKHGSSTAKRKEKKKSASRQRVQTRTNPKPNRDEIAPGHQEAEKPSMRKNDAATPSSSDRENVSPSAGTRSQPIQRTPKKSLSEITASLLKQASINDREDADVIEELTSEQTARTEPLRHMEPPDLSATLKSLGPLQGGMSSPLVRSSRRKSSIPHSRRKGLRTGSSRRQPGGSERERLRENRLLFSEEEATDVIDKGINSGGVALPPGEALNGTFVIEEALPNTARGDNNKHNQTSGAMSSVRGSVKKTMRTKRDELISATSVDGASKGMERKRVGKTPGATGVEQTGDDSAVNLRLEQLQRTLGGMSPLDLREKMRAAEKNCDRMSGEESDSIASATSVKTKAKNNTKRSRTSKIVSAKKSNRPKVSIPLTNRDTSTVGISFEDDSNIRRALPHLEEADNTDRERQTTGRKHSKRTSRNQRASKQNESNPEVEEDMTERDGIEDDVAADRSSEAEEAEALDRLTNNSKEPSRKRRTTGNELDTAQDGAVGVMSPCQRVKSSKKSSLGPTRSSKGVTSSNVQPSRRESDKNASHEEIIDEEDQSGVESAEMNDHHNSRSLQISSDSSRLHSRKGEPSRSGLERHPDERGRKVLNQAKEIDSQDIDNHPHRTNKTGKDSKISTQQTSDRQSSHLHATGLENDKISKKNTSLRRHRSIDMCLISGANNNESDITEQGRHHRNTPDSSKDLVKQTGVPDKGRGTSVKRHATKAHDTTRGGDGCDVISADNQPEASMEQTVGDSGSKKLERLHKMLGGMSPLDRTLQLLSESRAKLRATMPSLSMSPASKAIKKAVTPSSKKTGKTPSSTSKEKHPPDKSKGKNIVKRGKMKTSGDQTWTSPAVKMPSRRKGAKKGTWPPKTPRMVIDSDVEGRDVEDVALSSEPSESDMEEAPISPEKNKKRTVNDLCDLDVVMKCSWEEARLIRSELPNKRLKTVHDTIISNTTGDLLELIKLHSQLKRVTASEKHAKAEVTKKRKELLDLQKQQRDLSGRVTKLRRQRESTTAADSAFDDDVEEFLSSLGSLYRETRKVNR